jgi:IS605 OrfB family transposase
MKPLKRKSEHILDFATGYKRNKLDDFFAEYKRVVNCFIDLYWEMDRLPPQTNTTHYSQIDSWLLGKAMKCAGNQALQNIRSRRKEEKDLLDKAYKRVYRKAINKGKKWDLVAKRKTQWMKGKTFRKRASKPVFKEDTITLNSDLCHIQDNKKASHFDMWIRIGSVFGNRFSLILPTKKHWHYNDCMKQGFETKKSITLWKSPRGHYYVRLYHEKQVEETPKEGKVVGIDVGVNKLMSTSENKFHGTKLTEKIDKLNRRKQGSRNWRQTIAEIKHYIDYEIKQLSWDNLSALVLEDLSVKSMMKIKDKKDKYFGKEKRKKIGHWNIRHLTQRIMEKCEMYRVHLAFVPPQYTSQRCSKCGEIHAESRRKELYECVACGYTCDADYNASLNILHLFLGQVGSLSSPTEQKQLIPSFA